MRTSQQLAFVLLCLLLHSSFSLPIADNSETKRKSDKDSNRKCWREAVDLALVVDDSSSIGNTDFKQILRFLRNLTNSIDIGPTTSQTQVAFITFSDGPKLVFSLTGDHQKLKLFEDFNTFTRVGGGTDIAKGMNFATQEVFTREKGDRPDIQNVMLVITDGQDNSNVAGARKAAANKNITIYTIGIGNGVNSAQLEEIVGKNSSRVYSVSNFNALDRLNEDICSDIAADIMSPDTRSAALHWPTLLPILIAALLAFLILSALCLTVIPLRRRLNKEELIAAAAASAENTQDTSPLTDELAEQDNCETPNGSPPAALLPPLQPPNPPSSDKKWNPAILNQTSPTESGVIGAAEDIRAAAMVQRPSENGAIIPPVPLPRKRPTEIDAAQHADDIRRAEIIQRPSENGLPESPAALQADGVRHAEIIQRPPENGLPVSPAAQFREGKEVSIAKIRPILPPKPNAQEYLANNHSDNSKAAVIFRTGNSAAPVNGRMSSFNGMTGNEEMDLSKTATKMRHERGTEPSTIFEDTACPDAEGQAKLAEIVRRKSAMHTNTDQLSSV